MSAICNASCSGQGSIWCYLSFLGRILLIPLGWWILAGFSGVTGVQCLERVFEWTTPCAAAVMATLLAAVTTVAFMPCCLYRRWFRRNRSAGPS